MTHIFIMNPVAGRHHEMSDLRRQLEEFDDLDYYVFSTRHSGYEKEIVRQVLEIFEGEKLRFYSCGGMGTLRNILNGFPNFRNVEIAMVPWGRANDFLQVFSQEDAQRFYDMGELIHGDVVACDYIRTNHGICLNNLSTGLDTYVLERERRRRDNCIVNQSVPYMTTVLHSVFFSNAQNLTVTIDGERTEDTFSEMIFGNGKTLVGKLNFSEQPETSDGMGEYLMVPGASALATLMCIPDMIRKDYDSIRQKTMTGQWRKIRITSKDGRPVPMNQDGVMIDSYSEWEAQIVSKGLPLVVPKGVTL